jgi:thiol-disulfide isomerase/thioredoxin
MMNGAHQTTTSRPRRLRRLIRGIGLPDLRHQPGGSRRLAVRVVIGLLLLVSLSGGLAWIMRHREAPVRRAPGQFIADFAIKDVRTGQLDRLSDHRGRVVAIIFTGTNCPVGELYFPRLNRLAEKYESRGVDFLAINSNASESADLIAEHARLTAIRLPVLKDPENRVADLLLAERTCEALLVDGGGRLRYRGAVDDQYSQGSRRDAPTQDFLARAIEAVLDGKPVNPEMTQVVGCPIERARPAKQLRATSGGPSSRAAPSGDAWPKPDRSSGPVVTYSSDVAAILHSRCATCHRPGQVAPFSLLTYEHARRWSSSIVEVLTDRRMPPWHADPRYGHFGNDRSLTEQERSRLINWVEQGSPPGDLTRAPAPPKFPHGWSIGAPDVVFEFPETIKVSAEGSMPILHFRIPTNLKEDLWVQAAEVRPSDRAVVHHIFVYSEVYDKDTQRQKQKAFLAAYLPGDVPPVFPPGVGKKIPAGSTLVYEIHYNPIGAVRFDRPSVGVIASKQPPRHQAITRGLAEHNLRIPPGVADHVERADWTIKHDIHLLSLSPHMHLRGKSFVYQAHFPDGKVETLLSVPRYDFNWQSVYRLVEPRSFKKGTRIYCEAHYDNSPANLANPDPSRIVRWGEQSWDEMMMGYLDYYED